MSLMLGQNLPLGVWIWSPLATVEKIHCIEIDSGHSLRTGWVNLIRDLGFILLVLYAQVRKLIMSYSTIPVLSHPNRHSSAFRRHT